MSARLFLLLTLCICSCCALAAQDAPQTDQVSTIRTTTREVILDVVVRDKHHHTIGGLRPEEIQVYEDGVRQKINAFRDISGAEQLRSEEAFAKNHSLSGNRSEQSKSATTLPELNFVSVVFAQIAPLNLEFAREAVLDFLKSDDLPNTYVTIYRLDHTLGLVQAYTSDKALLTKAVNAVAKGLRTGNDFGLSASVVAGANAIIKTNVTNILAQPNTTPSTALALQNIILDPLPGVTTDPLWARNAGSEDVSVTLGNALLTQAHMQSGLRFANSLATGMSTLEALRRLVESQTKLPGRKVVLYLSDGLTLPMDRRDAVDSIIGFANRVDVSFYAVDTEGLDVNDPLIDALSAMEQAGAESAANNVSPRIGHLEDDDLQLAAMADKQLGMQELSESTGGFAVTNTNEIAEPMRRVMEDIRTHYEVAYTPSATTYDGRFRKIEVRISRPHVKVQTRSGYFAVRDINGEPLQPYEMAALQAINARPAPVEFPFQTSLMKFRPRSDGVMYEMGFDVPLSSLRVRKNPKTGKSFVHLSIVALIHKSNGEVVGKVSRDLMREVSKADLPHLKDEHIIYAEPLELPGGHYWIDSAVTDEIAEKSTVKRMATFVDSGKEFGVSSLQLVKNIEPLSGPRDTQDPFESGGVRIMPSLSASMPSDKPISVYFVVYATDSSPSDPKITVQLYRDGKEVGRRTLTPHRQADGSMPVLLRLHPSPGQCDMVVTARQGTQVAQSSLSVNIAQAPSVNAN